MREECLGTKLEKMVVCVKEGRQKATGNIHYLSEFGRNFRHHIQACVFHSKRNCKKLLTWNRKMSKEAFV